jgi:hypothetical protein
MRHGSLSILFVLAVQFAASDALAATACKRPDAGCVTCPNGQFLCSGPPGGGGIVLNKPEDHDYSAGRTGSPEIGSDRERPKIQQKRPDKFKWY